MSYSGSYTVLCGSSTTPLKGPAAACASERREAYTGAQRRTLSTNLTGHFTLSVPVLVIYTAHLRVPESEFKPAYVWILKCFADGLRGALDPNTGAGGLLQALLLRQHMQLILAKLLTALELRKLDDAATLDYLCANFLCTQLGNHDSCP